jgi:lysophospholipase L1-like esterase
MVQQKPLHVVHMGDSITEGQYIDASVRWSSLISRRLVERFGEVRFVSINRGVSGETTRMGLERYPKDVQQAQPDLLTIQFGMNDCNCWDTDNGLPRVSEGAFKANLVEMIERGRRFGARHVILSTNPRTLRQWLVLPSGEIYEEANTRYSQLVREVALETGVVLCDIRAAFEPFSDEELEPLLLPYPDHLHLSPEGNVVYADTIWPFIETAMEALLAGGVTEMESIA